LEAVRALVEGPLTIETDAAGPALVLSWSGASSDPHPERVLLPYLQEASSEAARRRVALELHFEGLDYCNSATLAVLADFIQARDRSQGKLICVFDRGRRWQKLSLDALRVFEGPDHAFELRIAQ
jgi:hypothetical protein